MAKYIDLLKKSVEQQRQDQVSFMEQESKIQLDMDILSTQKEIANCTNKIETMKAQFPLQTQKLIECYQNLEDLSRGLDKLQELKAELF